MIQTQVKNLEILFLKYSDTKQYYLWIESEYQQA